MTTPFGPLLIGETEKMLDALLRRFLEGSGLTEKQWVTLRVAGLHAERGGAGTTDALVAALAHQTQFPDAADLVRDLTERGLLRDGRLTDAGRAITEVVQTRINAHTRPIWSDLPADDVAAATRLLNEVVARARAVLASMPANAA